MFPKKIDKHTYIPNMADAIAANKELENNPMDKALQKLLEKAFTFLSCQKVSSVFFCICRNLFRGKSVVPEFNGAFPLSASLLSYAYILYSIYSITSTYRSIIWGNTKKKTAKLSFSYFFSLWPRNSSTSSVS